MSPRDSWCNCLKSFPLFYRTHWLGAKRKVKNQLYDATGKASDERVSREVWEEEKGKGGTRVFTARCTDLPSSCYFLVLSWNGEWAVTNKAL